MNRFTRFTLLLSLAVIATPALGGSLTPPGAPAAGSNLPTLTDIYNRLDTGAAIAAPGAFKEPAVGPTSSTGRTLNEIGDKLPVADNVNGLKADEAPIGKTFWGLRTDGTWGVQTGTSHIASLVCQAHWTGVNCNVCGLGWSGANCDVCAVGWSGANCDVCSTQFTGANCDVCISRWTGANCDVCTLGWSGANCDTPHLVVNKTGQTTSYGTGDDGEYEYGIDPPITPTGGTTGAYNTPALTNSSRFTDNGNGTVTDNQTALIWLKNANCFGKQNWVNALTSANTLKGDNTQCNLSDGSIAGQWRLPNINELHSLGPAWPPGSPFTAVSFYWSSSSYAISTNDAWYVYMLNGYMYFDAKVNLNYVWPVRAGQ